MKTSVLPIWVFLMILALPACQDSDAGQETDQAAEVEAEADAAEENLDNASLLENGVAQRVRTIIEAGGEVYGKTADFEYLEFEAGQSTVDPNSSEYREIRELGLVLKSNPRMNTEIDVYADHSGSQESPEGLAKMRGLFIKSTLIENGVSPQMVSVNGQAAEQEGDGSDKESNRVVVRLLGE